MILEQTTSEGWLSNTWLVGDAPGGKAVLIDTGGPLDPIVAALEAHRLELTHVLCTHHHLDHVAHNATYKGRFGCPICGGRREARLFGDLDVEFEGGEVIETGGLAIRPLHIPGHTVGQLAFVVNDERVFTGDTLFRGSVGGTRAPGHGTYEQLEHSILEVLLRLPPPYEVHPGHTDPTTIACELEENPFVRYWRGVERPTPRPCSAFGHAAALLLEARDYDGGTKCLVRFQETGALDIVPGSRVQIG